MVIKDNDPMMRCATETFNPFPFNIRIVHFFDDAQRQLFILRCKRDDVVDFQFDADLLADLVIVM